MIGNKVIDKVRFPFESEEDFRKHLLSEMIEASPDYIVITDIKGNIIYCNPATRDMIGIKNEEDIQLAFLCSMGECNLITNEGIISGIKEGIWNGEAFIIRYDGVEIPVSQTIVAHKSESGEVEYLSIIARDITERKQLEYMMSRQALYDTLTGLPNRRHLYQILEQITENPNEAEKIAFLFIDLDGFKEVNDDLGHHAGDEVLKTTAFRLQRIIRNCDFICRYAGDEFVVILKLKGAEGIRIIAERILDSLNKPYLIENKEVKISGSIGVSVYPDHGHDEELLIKMADKAMYEVKKNGKGNFRIHN